MNEIELVTRPDGGQDIVIDGEKAVGLARGWECLNPRVVIDKRGRSYANFLIEYTVDGGYGPEDQAFALDELSAREAIRPEIAKAARDLVAKRIGFAEFKRIVRENS